MSSGDSSALLEKEVVLTLGGVIVGTWFSFLTMGVVLVCAWIYFTNFTKDRWPFKVLAAACVLMSLADTAGTAVWSYDWAVLGYGNPQVLGFNHWALTSEAVLLGTVTLIVQTFFAWRIWRISFKRNWWLPTLIVIVSLLAWCIIIWMATVLVTDPLIAEMGRVLPTGYVWLVGSVVGDVLISISMFYYLDFRLRQNDMRAVVVKHNRFTAIIFRTVQCNVLSLICQALAIALFNRPTVGMFFVLTDMTLAKVYTFSLLVSMSARSIENGNSNFGDVSTAAKADSMPLSHLPASRVPPGHISVAVEQEIHDDDDKNSWPQENEDYALRQVKIAV